MNPNDTMPRGTEQTNADVNSSTSLHNGEVSNPRLSQLAHLLCGALAAPARDAAFECNNLLFVASVADAISRCARARVLGVQARPPIGAEDVE